MIDLPSSHRLRKGRHSQTGVTYMVTTTTIRRAPIFRDLTAARCVVRTLAAAVERGELDLLAYVLMPDHLHCLLTLTGSLSLHALMQQVKSVSAHRCGRQLWQAGYHDHALRDEDSLINFARYIVANPVRAGLADRVGDYPHWDAIWLPQ
ncbi:MAG: transposase [Methyloversatilis sp.]|nr:transposase [Methyloversatilis sp.]